MVVISGYKHHRYRLEGAYDTYYSAGHDQDIKGSVVVYVHVELRPFVTLIIRTGATNESRWCSIYKDQSVNV